MSSGTTLLRVHSLDAWWGGAQALFGVSLEVEAGQMVVLQGLNGAGKSTLLQALAGIGPRVRGSVQFDGQDLAGWPAHRRARAGLGYVAEDRRLFTELSVRDNLRIAARGSAAEVAAREEEALALFPALRGMLSRSAAQMSGGEQQMLAVARTLMTAPRLLLLDEPCEGIAPVLVQAMRDALLALRACGATLLVAEQNRILADRADRRVVLTAGRVDGQSAP